MGKASENKKEDILSLTLSIDRLCVMVLASVLQKIEKSGTRGESADKRAAEYVTRALQILNRDK